MNVLIVDDEPLVARAIRRTLYDLEERYPILLAVCGEDAVRMLESTPCAVAVVDMSMPGMSGLELLTILRDRWPTTHRIVLSGYADQRTVAEASVVAHRFLAKPCFGAVLRAAILDAIEGGRA